MRVILPYRAGRLTAQRAYLFRDLVRRLPPPVAPAHPWLLRTAASSCRFVGDYEQALAWSRQALTASEDVDADLWAHAVHGVMVMLTSFTATASTAGRASDWADDLLAAGFASVRRYQLGIPVWRALGRRLCDRGGGSTARRPRATARRSYLDAREPREFAAGTAAGARSLPASPPRARQGHG